MKGTTTHFINGKKCGIEKDATIINVKPSTQSFISKVVKGDEAIVEDSVLAANTAFQTWRKYKASKRGEILRKAAQLLRENANELARIEVEDSGKALQEACDVDVPSSVESLEFYAGLASTLYGQQYDLGDAFAYTRREPLGVCLGIGAWNYPLQIACWKSAPALACGNTVIFKPSEYTPRSALMLANIYKEAGLPDGVFNVVQGDSTTGKMLVAHPLIQKVSLTGSVETGRSVMASAAKTLKNVTMELGGKSPLIIFEDANLDDAVKASMLANFYTQGEVCSNATRVFVHESLIEQFLSKVIKSTKKLIIGDPMNRRTQVGALISEQHYNKVMSYINLANEQGAKLECGGKRVIVSGCEKGFFVEPTVFSKCHDDMTIVREEIFGPVMSVLSFSKEQEVIERSNNTHFGLAAGVFTQNINRAHRVVSQLEAGTCWINNYNITPVELPFGGCKQSGIGRENGTAVLDYYTQIKSVYVEMTGVDSPYPL